VGEGNQRVKGEGGLEKRGQSASLGPLLPNHVDHTRDSRREEGQMKKKKKEREKATKGRTKAGGKGEHTNHLE